MKRVQAGAVFEWGTMNARGGPISFGLGVSLVDVVVVDEGGGAFDLAVEVY